MYIRKINDVITDDSSLEFILLNNLKKKEKKKKREMQSLMIIPDERKDLKKNRTLVKDLNS